MYNNTTHASNVYLGHYTDHLIHGTHNLTVMLSLLFSSMHTHSRTPDAMLVITIAPIPKGPRKSLKDSGNYRGITLRWSYNLHIMQNHQPISVHFVVHETFKYYVNSGSNVHAILLDATNAFD